MARLLYISFTMTQTDILKGDTLQDYELVNRIKQGERALFGQLAEKYYDEIFRYCYYQTGNEHSAYDCTQETFFHLLRFLDNYTERNHFKAYLLRIALNVCRDYYRKYERQNVSSFPPENHMGGQSAPSRFFTNTFGAPSHPSPEQQVEIKLLIQSALQKLPQVQREVIILYYYYGYKQREIARITCVPLSTVKTRLRAGTGKLQEIFQQAGLSSPLEY